MISRFEKLVLATIAALACMAALGATHAATVSSPLGAAIAADLRAQLALRMGLPESRFQVEIENFKTEPVVNDSHIVRAHLLGLGAGGARRLDGLLSAPLIVENAGGTREVQFMGQIHVIGPVHVARRNLTRGHVIEAADLQTLDTSWRTLPSGAAATPSEALLGQRVKNMISSGETLYGALLDEPFAVRSGDMVELTVIAGPGVMIRSRAVAKGEGRTGDAIRIEQPDTKKALTGFVTGDKAVEVKL